MSALLLVTVLAAGPCFEVREAAPGWKRLELPARLSTLSALEDLPQFRSGEPVRVVDREAALYRSGQRVGGSTEFELELPSGTQAVTVTFNEPLRGAKVDVSSWGMSVMREQRVRTASLSFPWGSSKPDRVWLRVHHHLREPPVLMSVEFERLVLPAQLNLPSSEAPSLYFFQAEPDQRVVLCNDPGRKLSVRREALERMEHVTTVLVPAH